MNKKLFALGLVVLTVILTVIGYRLWLHYGDNDSENVNVVETVITVVATPTKAVEPVATMALPTITPVPTIIVRPTVTSTATPAPSCIVGYGAEDRVLDRCDEEEIQVNVAYTTAEDHPVMIYHDEETSSLELVTWMQESITFDEEGNSTTGYAGWQTFQLKTHLDNRKGDNNLPAADFGPESNTWGLSVEGSKRILNELSSSKTVFAVLEYGDVVEILIEDKPIELEDGTYDFVTYQYYLTVVEENGHPTVRWLEPLENQQFDRAGVSLYIGLTGCGEGGTCMSTFSTRLSSNPEAILITSEGDWGIVTLVSASNVKINVNGDDYQLGKPTLIYR